MRRGFADDHVDAAGRLAVGGRRVAADRRRAGGERDRAGDQPRREDDSRPALPDFRRPFAAGRRRRRRRLGDALRGRRPGRRPAGPLGRKKWPKAASSCGSRSIRGGHGAMAQLQAYLHEGAGGALLYAADPNFAAKRFEFTDRSVDDLAGEKTYAGRVAALSLQRRRDGHGGGRDLRSRLPDRFALAGSGRLGRSGGDLPRVVGPTTVGQRAAGGARTGRARVLRADRRQHLRRVGAGRSATVDCGVSRRTDRRLARR